MHDETAGGIIKTKRIQEEFRQRNSGSGGPCPPSVRVKNVGPVWPISPTCLLNVLICPGPHGGGLVGGRPQPMGCAGSPWAVVASYNYSSPPWYCRISSGDPSPPAVSLTHAALPESGGATTRGVSFLVAADLAAMRRRDGSCRLHTPRRPCAAPPTRALHLHHSSRPPAPPWIRIRSRTNPTSRSPPRTWRAAVGPSTTGDPARPRCGSACPPRTPQRGRLFFPSAPSSLRRKRSRPRHTHTALRKEASEQQLLLSESSIQKRRARWCTSTAIMRQ